MASKEQQRIRAARAFGRDGVRASKFGQCQSCRSFSRYNSGAGYCIHTCQEVKNQERCEDYREYVPSDYLYYSDGNMNY